MVDVLPGISDFVDSEGMVLVLVFVSVVEEVVGFAESVSAGVEVGSDEEVVSGSFSSFKVVE